MDKHILRITNSGGETSSPLNSFTLARARLFCDEVTTYLAYKDDFDGEALACAYFEAKGVDTAVQRRIVFRSAGEHPWVFRGLVLDWRRRTEAAGKQALVHIHKPKRGFLYLLLCRRTCRRVPVVYTVHNNYGNYGFKDKLLLFFCFVCADRVTFVSRDARTSFAGKMIEPAKHKAVTIQNGVDTERIQAAVAGTSAREPRPECREVLRLAAVARLKPQKNIGFLLDVMARLGDGVVLEVFGTGSRTAELEGEIERRGLQQRVVARGNVTRDTLYTELAQKDVFVSPSLWEGLPMALMEAMAVGLPCVVSDIEPHREVGTGLEGLQCLELDRDLWAGVLAEWSASGCEALYRLGQDNREVVERWFSIRRMQIAYRALYDELWGDVVKPSASDRSRETCS